jgi:hypothetical protein
MSSLDCWKIQRKRTASDRCRRASAQYSSWSPKGRSNKAIGERLAISQGAVQKHVSTIFNKLGLPAGENDDRRILAVLAYLLAEPHAQPHR